MNALRFLGIVAVCSFTVGCMTPTAAPFAPEVYNQTQYDADLVQCAKDLGVYHPKFNAAEVGQSAAQGAASNATGAAVNPLVPILGAAGAATAQALKGIDALNAQKRAVFLECIKQKTEWDRSALVLITAG